MIPTDFPESNCVFGAPSDLDASQVLSIPALAGKIRGGNLDGARFVAIAWKPTPEEIEQIKSGAPIFLSMLGGLAPHFLTTNITEAAYTSHLS
jgi:hypothetical protein